MLTLEKFNEAKPKQVLAQGVGFITHPFSGEVSNVDPETGLAKVKWIAVKGGGNDFAVYHSLCANLEPAERLDGVNHLERSFKDVYRYGQKLFSKPKIKEFIKCTDQLLDYYRY